MTESVFDTAETAARWRATAERRAAYLAAATERMLDAAGVVPGARVLDLGTGTGDTAFLAAARVGPGGHVLATDISEQMLKIARETAATAGLTNVDFQIADAGALTLEPAAFDAVIARFSLMFLADIGTALRGIRQVLRPGGRLAALVWASEADNPFLSLTSRVARRTGRLRVPEEVVQGPFRLHDGARLEADARGAGWEEVTVEPIALAIQLPDLAAVDESVQSSPMAKAILGALSDDEVSALLGDARAEAEQFRVAEGYRFPALAQLLRARNGA